MSDAQAPSRLARFDGSGLPLLVARILVGATFVYLGLNKMYYPVEFLKQVRMFEMLPESPAIFLNGTAIVLPWLEIVCGLMLLLGVYLRGAALVIAVMLTVFTPAVLMRAFGVMAEEGISFFHVAFDCGCGTGVEIIWRKMLMNVGLFLLAVYALFSRSRRFCPAA